MIRTLAKRGPYGPTIYGPQVLKQSFRCSKCPARNPEEGHLYTSIWQKKSLGSPGHLHFKTLNPKPLNP